MVTLLALGPITTTIGFVLLGIVGIILAMACAAIFVEVCKAVRDRNYGSIFIALLFVALISLTILYFAGSRAGW